MINALLTINNMDTINKIMIGLKIFIANPSIMITDNHNADDNFIKILDGLQLVQRNY